MACSLQQLFAVEEEFEDEDFLSAVEDAENQFAGSLPVNAGRLRPVSSRAQETVQAQSSRLLLLHPTAPSEALGLPDLDLCLPTSSMPRADSCPSCIGTAPLRPVSTSSSWIGNQQRRVTVTEGLREPARPQSSALHPLLTFESQQQQVGGFEGPEQDEFDKVLASMELEEPGMELECGVSSEATPILPAQQREGSVLAKKARVVDLSGSCQKGPVPATHKAGIMSAQDESLDPVIQCRTPRPPLRPGAAGHLPVPTALTVPTQQSHWEVCPQRSPVQALQPLQAARGTIQSSPQNCFPCQPFQSPSSWLSGKVHLPRPRTPNSSCSTPSSTSSGLFPRIPLQPQAPVSSIGSPVGTPKGPHSSLGPQGALQTPIVTNHLVQLVTAASRTPQQPTHPSTRAKTRRFPGPAGILPHQSGRSLEDIMVSTPQTPTHGALAKFQTEIVASSQASVEEDFGRGPWLTMKSALGLDERDPSCFLCTYSIVMVLRKQAALKQLPRNKVPNMAVMIKSLTRSTMDASVVFKDPTGEMQGTVHRLLLETRQNELKPGSVLLLKQIGVFSPSLRNHYLNVTPNNLVHIYSPDSGDGSFLKPSQPFPKDSGSFQHDVAAKPEEGFRTAQNLAAEASPEEELPEADDLDGLLSELPEDFFCGTSS
ncbi:homologous recombination OB-fold protein isoform X3 [Symphalangus syndactylus]|uniref:homologous recombination OB-fold protein isoform X3 n=1 Tax=Symphalangus syndactylus TaxID=9590 RepID=UPI0024431519|nr:homologous recombination OB-fold protein isoform X3 [Symphalangus syndactylus]